MGLLPPTVWFDNIEGEDGFEMAERVALYGVDRRLTRSRYIIVDPTCIGFLFVRSVVLLVCLFVLFYLFDFSLGFPLLF